MVVLSHVLVVNVAILTEWQAYIPVGWVIHSRGVLTASTDLMITIYCN